MNLIEQARATHEWCMEWTGDLPPDPDSAADLLPRLAGEIERLQGIIKEAIRSMDGFEQAEDAQELHGMLEEAQGILYTSGLAAAKAAEGN